MAQTITEAQLRSIRELARELLDEYAAGDPPSSIRILAKLQDRLDKRTKVDVMTKTQFR